MPIKALEMGVCFHKVPVLGKMWRGGWRCFRRAFERRVKFFLGELLLRNSRDVKEGSGNGRYFIKLIWVPFLFLDPDYVRSLSLGAIWNCCEGPGLP